MKLFSKGILAMLLVYLMLVLSGCGKLGQSEAEKMVKDSCKIPDSYKTVNYTVNEKAGFSRLDFTAQNLMGVNVPGTQYFSVAKDKVIPIDTSDVPKNILEDIEKNHPEDFVKAVAICQALQKVTKEMSFKYDLAEDTYKSTMENKDNFFFWDDLKSTAAKINPSIKKYRDIYDQLPDFLKEKIGPAPKYFKVDLKGSFGSFSAHAERTDIYPEG